jgi:sRNA-binding carbon storage regulator CsrA
MGLVLKRNQGEMLRIFTRDGEITVKNLGPPTRLDIDAPRHLRVLRAELEVEERPAAEAPPPTTRPAA